MIRNKKLHVGLDIGSHSLKIMEVLADCQPPLIKNIGVHELPYTPCGEELPKKIKSLLEAAKVYTKEVNISISGLSVVVRFIELPLMKETELSGALPYEAERHIPFNIEEMILDHVVLEKNQIQKKMKVLLVGAKKNFIDRRIKLLKEAGLTPSIIDVDAFAVLNAFLKSVPESQRQGKTIGLLNIGDVLTNVVITHRQLPWMVRDISLGGANITQALKDQLNISAEEAQALKHNPAKKTEVVLAILREVFQKLLDEIKLSFTYYENQYGKGVDEVYISGGSTKLNGLANFLKDGIGLEAKHWSPTAYFKIDSKIPKETLERFELSLAVCSGLALR